MEIKEFYKGRDIFITGGTGFMGKVLIEKLLRSCSDLNKIFILIRNKKNKTPKERLKDITDVPLFDVIKSTNINLFDKLEVISGDVTEIGFGISEEDFNKLQNVSIVFHSAASVRFDDPLKQAVLMNTRGTLEMMKLAQKLKNIECVLHVSTTYCYPDRHVIDEKLYPPYADWKTTIKIAEKYDNEVLNILKSKYSKYQPNTYTFTKSLAEQIVDEYKDVLPVVIYRPSIVVSTLSDPFPGWIDNFNGPVAMLLACGLGIYRTMYGEPDIVSDYTPVDIAIKGMITAAYVHAAEKADLGTLKIYNCSTSSIKSVSMGELIETGKQLVRQTPLERALWIPGGSITRCRVYNYIRFMLFHILAAVIVDTILKISKNKPFLVKLQRRIYAANLALYYFATTNWTFQNVNFLKLGEKLENFKSPEFEFLNEKNVSIEDFIRNAVEGSRKFLLKEKEGSIERAKRKYKKMVIADKILKLICVLLLIYFLRKIFFLNF